MLLMRTAAFTALELIVVITLMGLLMAVAMPRLGALRDAASVHAAMGDLGAAFSLARQAAVTRRTMVSIVIDTAAGVVELRASGRALLRHGLRSAYGIVLWSNKDSTVYDARGLGYGLANLTITVQRGASVDTLTMSRLGRVRW
jgi:Tfp pilus assembly protein FimT